MMMMLRQSGFVHVTVARRTGTFPYARIPFSRTTSVDFFLSFFLSLFPSLSLNHISSLFTHSHIYTTHNTGCAIGGCKCCCYQEMTITSGGQELGSLKEDCWYCVPSFQASGPDGQPLYKIHPPTCCMGICPNCCTEGNPCGKGCCKVPFWVFPANQLVTDGDAPYIGKILKKPKSLATELFTDANAFDITFPDKATVAEKGVLLGSSFFINSNFFEGNQGGE